MVGKNEIDRHYMPINSYGVIGDCHSTVLISPDGAVDWGCLTDFDSLAIFCRLLDGEHGGRRWPCYQSLVDIPSLPDFDSPAIFCRLLDAEHGGYFQIAQAAEDGRA